MTMTARFISGWPRVRRVWFVLVSAIMLVVPISAAAGQLSELRPGADVRIRAPGVVTEPSIAGAREVQAQARARSGVLGWAWGWGCSTSNSATAPAHIAKRVTMSPALRRSRRSARAWERSWEPSFVPSDGNESSFRLPAMLRL